MHEPTPNIASLTIDHYIFLVNKCSLKWAKNWSRDSISEYASLLQYFVVYFVQVLPSSIASIITRTWDRLMVSVAVTSLIRGIFTWRSARTSVDTVISIQLRRHGADMLYTCAMYVWNNAYLSTLLCPNSGLDIGNYTLHGADGCINHQSKILGQVEKQPQCGDMYVEQTIINAVTWLRITKFDELWMWRLQ